MPLKLNIGWARKVGLPEFGSLADVDGTILDR